MLVKSCREMFSDFWCKGTIKKATDKMHYTYNEKLFFRKKAYLCTRNQRISLCMILVTIIN